MSHSARHLKEKWWVANHLKQMIRSKRGSWSRSERKFQVSSPLSKNHQPSQNSSPTAKFGLLTLSLSTHSPSPQLRSNPAKSQQLLDRRTTAVKKISRNHQSWMWSWRNRRWSKVETWALSDSLNVKNIRSTANHCHKVRLNKAWPATTTKQPRSTTHMRRVTLKSFIEKRCHIRRKRMSNPKNFQNLTAVPKM